jgi:protein involved in polysaccharide export with SLBB domain
MYRKTGSMTISALAAGAEEDITITDSAVRVGDVVTVTTTAAPETGLAIITTWVTAAGTINVRISNLNAAVALTAGAVSVRYCVHR